MNEGIRLLGTDEPLPMELLLEADPSEEMISRYITDSRILAAEENGRMIGVCVVLAVSPEIAEIKNIAVAERARGRGIAKSLIKEAAVYAKREKFSAIEIGTGNSSLDQLALYQKCGFRIAAVERDFFTRHYPKPIFENGIQCRDMIRLQYKL
ncbi:GNAT family N-acetyltransferase [Indiicoccus explosivorum]|uniref:GNAT family N-acetyltransferase n=1 Tax=Indiicoccus explosivorum TaxID=1917864 RepID=UPI001F4EE1D3|nr:GNAT family N-acetyltransferase [Indiicoccus explosivorum]